MGILASELRRYVIRPTLERIDLWSESAENLLLGTAAHESRLGTHLAQVQGPALGIYQIEPATHNDIWDNYLKYHSKLCKRIKELLPGVCSTQDREWALITNLAYSSAIARVIYRRIPQPLPQPNDIEGLATYWKKHYNTPQGRGEVKDFIQHYNRYIIHTDT